MGMAAMGRAASLTNEIGGHRHYAVPCNALQAQHKRKVNWESNREQQQLNRTRQGMMAMMREEGERMGTGGTWRGGEGGVRRGGDNKTCPTGEQGEGGRGYVDGIRKESQEGTPGHTCLQQRNFTEEEACNAISQATSIAQVEMPG